MKTSGLDPRPAGCHQQDRGGGALLVSAAKRAKSRQLGIPDRADIGSSPTRSIRGCGPSHRHPAFTNAAAAAAELQARIRPASASESAARRNQWRARCAIPTDAAAARAILSCLLLDTCLPAARSTFRRWISRRIFPHQTRCGTPAGLLSSLENLHSDCSAPCRPLRQGPHHLRGCPYACPAVSCAPAGANKAGPDFWLRGGREINAASCWHDLLLARSIRLGGGRGAVHALPLPADTRAEAGRS